MAQRASTPHDAADVDEEAEADQELHRSARIESYKMSSGGSMEKDQSAPLLSECASSENDSKEVLNRNDAYPVSVEEPTLSHEEKTKGENGGEREDEGDDSTVRGSQAIDKSSNRGGWKRMEGAETAEHAECSPRNHQIEKTAEHCVTVRAGDSLAGRAIAVLIHVKMMEIC